MLIVPTSRIILLKNPIEIDYMNELTFSNATAQYNYFYNLSKLECDNATYQRKDEVIRFPTDPSLNGITYDDLIQYNYCMYQNDKWSNKWFYAFVKGVTFDNPGMCYIELETDVWQSWMFDITFKNSFVEREHVNDDTVGAHTIPENLETGEYIIANKIKKAGYETSNMCFILATTMYPYITQNDGKWYLSGGYATNGNIYNSNLSGVEYWWYTNTTNGIEKLRNTIEAYCNSGQKDGIYMLFVCPESCFEKVLENQNEGYWGYVKQKQGSYNTAWMDASTNQITKPTTLNGYTPKNKKLLTYPYCYLLMHNGNGGTAIYHYELFKNTDTQCYFQIDSAICPGASIFLRPVQYKYNDPTFKDTMDGLPLGKFPMCSWNTDAYTNWLTQNSANIKFGMLQEGYNIGANVAQQNVVGAGSGLLGYISNVMQLYNKRDTATPQAEGNLNSGDVMYSIGETAFTAYQMCIKEEYARIIDNYFSMFGYKVNSVKIPNINGRTYWNYVKTIGCNIIGDIPQTDLQKIKDIFNNGVTFWHDPSKFLDYSQSNTIVS